MIHLSRVASGVSLGIIFEKLTYLANRRRPAVCLHCFVWLGDNEILGL